MNDTQKEFEAWHEKRRLFILDLQKKKVAYLLKDMNREGETFETTSSAIRQEGLFLALKEIDTSDFSVWQACQNLNNERIAKLEKTHKAEIALLNDAINDDKFLVRLCKQYEQALQDIWDGKAGSHFDAQMLAKEVLTK